MKSGICLFWIAVGAILTFAVTANTSVFNLHVAGFVIMVIGIIGLVTPKRGYEWLGRRVYVRRTRQGPGQPGGGDGVPALRAAQPGHGQRPGRHPGPAEPGAGPGGGPVAGAGRDAGGGDGHQRATNHGADRYDDLAPEPRERVPGDTEVIEDVYEEPPA